MPRRRVAAAQARGVVRARRRRFGGLCVSLRHCAAGPALRDHGAAVRGGRSAREEARSEHDRGRARVTRGIAGPAAAWQNAAMKDPRPRALALAAVVLTAAAADQSLVPAGSFNGVVGGKPAAVVTHDEPAVTQYVKAIRARFLPQATMYGEKDLPAAFAGTSLVVYATPSHPWFELHRKQLPFTFGDGVVAIDGREFRGARLRVITALRNPD